jgi:signal transduction histidine kinase
MKATIGKRMNNGIVVAAAIVLAIVVLSIWQYRRIRGTAAMVRHADSVSDRAGDVLVTYMQVELDHRNFQLTHDTSLLSVDLVLSLQAKIAGLRSLTVNDPDVRSRVDSLVAFFFRHGWTSYAPLSGLDREVAPAEPFASERITAILMGIGTDERRMLDQRRAVNEVRAAELQWTLWALAGAVVVLAVMVFRKIRVDLQVQMEEELNEQLLSRQKQITAAVILAQEEERSEIGKELHDNVNQILGASKLYINSAMTEEDMRQELLERSMQLVSNAINEIRKISKLLITPGLREIGLVESIEDIIDDLRRAGDRLTIDLDLQNISEDQIEDRRKLTVFRIVQEQLNNIVKHARATRVLIRLSGEQGHLVLTVADNGIGFDVSRHRKGVGITNIVSRAELFNGKVEIQSLPGEGCTLTVSLPM